MEDVVEKAVGRVIATMHDNLGEQLTIDDLARAAMFSKFHFSRIFQRFTGVTPGKFLATLRIQEAKHLLVTTSLNVADISLRVGYTSVGTFSSRFSRSVGVSPSMYRRMGGQVPQIPECRSEIEAQAVPGRVQGRVWLPPTHHFGTVFVGVFPDRIPQGPLIAYTLLFRSGDYVVDRVPPGVWYVLAYSVTGREDGWVGTRGPVTIRRRTHVVACDIRLRPKRPHDPPLLLALPDLTPQVQLPAA
jgi:AraC-like DNA-binding protein